MKGLVRSAIKAFPPLYRQVNRFRGWRLHEPDINIDIVGVGGRGDAHNFGAWALPRDLVLDRQSVVYGFGVGHDVSFDLAVIDKFGCDVHAFDSGPGILEQISNHKLGFWLGRYPPLPPQFKFHSYALGAKDGIESFQQSKHGSFEVVQDDIRKIQSLEMRTLQTIMKDLNHERIDLLKMDIEGFEYGVIKQMDENRIIPKCLLIEFHHYQQDAKEQTEDAVNTLRRNGYKLFWISDLGAEYGFIAT